MENNTFEKDIGTIKYGESKNVIFEISQDCDNIKRIHSTCTCTTVKKKGKELGVIYAPKKPKFNLTDVEKEIGIVYKDGSFDFLVIKAKIKI
jgi:hypothetical protein